MATLDEIKQREKQVHEDFYSGDGPLPDIEIDDVRRLHLTLPWEGGCDRYTDNKVAFHNLIHSEGGWEGKDVLDYACGLGNWAVYYALTGARSVRGFDLAEAAVQRGNARIENQSLEDRVRLDHMDATDLGYGDEMFDIVIGHGVIHHVIKYPGIFEQLHRVMRPGAKAYFAENLADFPLWKLHWWLNRTDHPSGDVPIFAADIDRQASMFSDVRVIGDTFFSSVKFGLFRKSQQRPDRVSSRILRCTHAIDQWMFRKVPGLRKWGSFSYLVLTK